MNKEENWRKIILSINDNSFFDLMRNYLGQIETPFNKQELINRLINFFNKEQTRETIIEILDEWDISLLTAVNILNGPSDSKLRNTFSDWTYLDLHNRIQNLEERFLLYKKDKFYYITPVFEEILQDKVLSPSVLIKSKEIDVPSDAPLWLNDSLMIAMLSFIQKNKSLIKIDGSIKKRGITELEKVFPTVFSGEDGLKRFHICTAVLTNLNLITSRDGLIHLIREKWNKLSTLTEDLRYAMYYGAVLAQSSEETSNMIAFFSRFYKMFPQDRAILNDSLYLYIKLYCEQKRHEMAPFQLNRISDILKLLNILISDKDSLRINSLLNFNDNKTHSEPPLVIQPNFEITVKPFITLPDSVVLASAMEIKQYDLFSHYTLTRESFLRAFDLGIKSEEILQKLRDLSQKEIPGNVIISLNDWEEDHRKVRLYSGVVLKVSDDKKMLVEKTAFLKPYILENLAPGVYLLDPEQEKLWMEALGELSISPLPASGDTSGEESEAFIPEIKHYDFESMGKRVKWSVQKVKEDRFLESHKESLLRKLNSSGIKGDERKEIEARIKRKLIILESQINRGIIRPEITEAKGMNFQGKVRLIESALLNSSDRLELNHYTQDGVESILVQPIELLKEEKERTLVGKILPDEEMIRIKVSKISKVKKIRSSLF